MTPSCPRCKSTTLHLIEHWGESKICFEQVNGVLVEHSQDDNPDPYKVVAVCEPCEKIWRVKGVTQIAEIDGWPAYHAKESNG